MHKFITKIAILAMCSLLFFPNTYKNTSYAAEINNDDLTINARAAYMMEANSNIEILSKNSDQKFPIASMTKLATLKIIFDEIEAGRLSPDEKISVSQNAASIEGSSAFLDAGSSYRVDELIKTIVIVSANDSCVALAEKICGTEELFVKKMNSMASQLNLSSTHFENCTGLPSPSHFSSAKDMAQIYLQVCDNPLYKKFSKIWMEDFIHPSGRKTGLVNTNRLIKTYDGCEGGKTGHTNEAKYCLTASASRSGMRLVAVVIGAETSKVRFAETSKMFNYGFANYALKNIVSKDIPIANITVEASTTKQTQLYANKEFSVLEKKGEETNYTTKLDLPQKIKAPISNGQVIGKLYVLNENKIVVAEIDLISNCQIEKIKFGEIFHKITQKW